MSRSSRQRAVDFVTFPIRAVMPFRAGEPGRWGLSSRASERFDYAAQEVVGYALDVGCGPYNRFVRNYLGGHGVGVDEFGYEELADSEDIQLRVCPDLSYFPFDDGSFDSVTMIATMHHIPVSKREAEVQESYRVLKSGGNLIVTQAIPIAEILVHRVTRLHHKLFGRGYDIDLLRQMHEEEEDHVTAEEIVERMSRAGFRNIVKKRFVTQWGMNRLFSGWKP